MAGKKRGQWNSSFTFILASVGSAVGLGNAWRFPGLAAKYGGGTFILVYLFMMIILGIPLLMMEISMGRKTQCGAIHAIGALNKKFQWIGWSATINAFVIVTYYAVVFGWVILMAAVSPLFSRLTGNPEEAGKLWMNTIQTTGTTDGFSKTSTPALIALIVAWLLIYVCIRNGASSVSKVVKFTVFAPVVCLLIMAVKGIFMPGGMAGLVKMITPDFSQLFTADGTGILFLIRYDGNHVCIRIVSAENVKYCKGCGYYCIIRPRCQPSFQCRNVYDHGWCRNA